jgi:hypothetical protein
MFEFYAEDYVESFLYFARDLCEEQRHAISNVRLAIDDAGLKLHSHLYDNGEEDSSHKASWKCFPVSIPLCGLYYKNCRESRW